MSMMKKEQNPSHEYLAMVIIFAEFIWLTIATGFLGARSSYDFHCYLGLMVVVVVAFALGIVMEVWHQRGWRSKKTRTITT